MVPPKRWSATVTELAVWMRTASQCGIRAILIGMRGRNWQAEPLESLTVDNIVYESRHALCHYYGLSMPGTRAKSSTCFNVRTTFAAPSAKCQCAPGTPHAHDFGDNAGRFGAGQARSKVKADFYERLMPLLVTQADPGHQQPLLASRPDCETVIRSSESPGSAFPTLAKEKEKIRIKEGHVRTKKKQEVQDHHDDLGEDLSGLGGDLDLHASDYIIVPAVDDTSDTETEAEASMKGLMLWCFLGHSAIPSNPQNIMIVSSTARLLDILMTIGPGVDVCEFCGGEARTITVAVRRRLRDGRNFDLVTHVDLGDPREQELAIKYLDEHEVLVLVMSPSCRSLGPTSNLNYDINYHTWRKHYDEDMPHVRFCGKAALHQLKHNRHFFVEQPWPTWLVREEPWPQVLRQTNVCSVHIDQCRVGQKGPTGLPAKKPTILLASAPELLAPFANLRCRGDHQHDQCWGSGQLHKLQVWTWNFAERVVQGILKLKASRSRTVQSAFPNMATGPQDPDQESEPTWHGCPGCRGRMARGRREHTREIGVCRYPHDAPEPEWECPGCRRNPPRPRGHEAHNDLPGQCRWASTAHRASASRHRQQHPREARRDRKSTRLNSSHSSVSRMPSSA
mgnify:CR=1 FL=1